MKTENEQKPLCIRCINNCRDCGFEVQEFGPRVKVDCYQCGKRRYGALCTVTQQKGK